MPRSKHRVAIADPIAGTSRTQGFSNLILRGEIVAFERAHTMQRAEDARQTARDRVPSTQFILAS